jgi:hypothetical protein
VVSIPERQDPTLDAVNAALEAEQKPYVSKNIGFGEIGHECSRYLWYKINTDEPEIFSSSTLRIFNSGHSAEARMADELRKVKGITLYTNDPERENKQYKFDFLGGRLTGRLDGVIVGLLQSPKTPHLWEHKETNEKKFKTLREVQVLSKWDEKYYAQAQLAMLGADLDRHYLTCSTSGLRDITSVRTELNKGFAEGLVNKAERIINAVEPPERIGGPDWWQCKNCRFHERCHNGQSN